MVLFIVGLSDGTAIIVATDLLAIDVIRVKTVIHRDISLLHLTLTSIPKRKLTPGSGE